MKQTKTIPFDWEEYNNNRDKYKVVTRGGDEVNQLTNFEIVHDCPLVGILLGQVEYFYINGKYLGISDSINDLQLQYEEEVMESWVNLYRNGGAIALVFVHTSEEEAKMSATKLNYIKTINLNDLV